ncbi:MAG: type II secretion system protein GspC [Candidatus Competibacteraceae bacterium]|nr:type II secretion system protein GspC [Candidatus Competibacteraceae bacterium]
MSRWSFISNPETVGRFALPVTLVLIILLAYDLARLTWNLIPLPDTLAPSSVGSGAAPSTAEPLEPVVDYAIIASWHLFGERDASKPSPAPLAVPETRLNLRLAGIFFSANPAKARALVAEPGGQELSYSVGDRLPGGVKLEQILRDRIILSRNGVLESLRLPKDTLASDARPTNSARSLPQIRSAAANNTPIDASSIANRLRREVVERPQALEDLAFASPYQQDGQFIGFRLRPGRDRKLFQQLGLRSGDIVTEINGLRLTSPTQGLTLFQELLNAEQIAVQVLRNGAEIPLVFALNAN